MNPSAQSKDIIFEFDPRLSCDIIRLSLSGGEWFDVACRKKRSRPIVVRRVPDATMETALREVVVRVPQWIRGLTTDEIKRRLSFVIDRSDQPVIGGGVVLQCYTKKDWFLELRVEGTVTAAHYDRSPSLNTSPA